MQKRVCARSMSEAVKLFHASTKGDKTKHRINLNEEGFSEVELFRFLSGWLSSRSGFDSIMTPSSHERAAVVCFALVE
jgi:hypothetical protein